MLGFFFVEKNHCLSLHPGIYVKCIIINMTFYSVRTSSRGYTASSWNHTILYYLEDNHSSSVDPVVQTILQDLKINLLDKACKKLTLTYCYSQSSISPAQLLLQYSYLFLWQMKGISNPHNFCRFADKKFAPSGGSSESKGCSLNSPHPAKT